MRTQHFLCCFCTLSLLIGGCASSHLLTVEDMLCRPGQKARLVGKLELRGVAVFNKGLDDRKLQFYVKDQFVGADGTNDEGYASVRYRSPDVGIDPLKVSYRGRDGVRLDTTASVFTWRKEDSILIVDIDDTICRTYKWSLLSSGEDPSPPMAGAVEVLRELSKEFRIVYLTARPREIVPKTRRWLERNGFPTGPVLTWDVDKYPWSQGDYKKERIDQIQDDFDNVRIGIGNTDKDHQAYRKRKMFTILLDPGQRARYIKRGVKVPDWQAVKELFRRNPQLHDQIRSDKFDVTLPGFDRDSRD